MGDRGVERDTEAREASRAWDHEGLPNTLKEFGPFLMAMESH